MGAAARVRLLLLPLLLGLGCINGGRCSWAQTLLPEQEVEALKGIARKLNKADWDFSVDPCSGSGNWLNVTVYSSNAKFGSNVTCDCSFNNHTECHVISLELMRQNLSGVLPDEMVNLIYLQYLDLSRNFIQGPIPASWADLPVFNLSLQGNRISGTLPKELGRMPKLKSIQLEGNQLAGSIPPELGNIISLQRFFISANNITGELPSTFSRLTNMTDFRVDGNSISGKIPSFIKNWQGVNRIDMQGTLMSGPIPSEISLLKNLTELRVTDLSGPRMKFPPLQNALHLTEVVLRNCSIYGEIPSFLGQMQYLKVLDLSFNKLTDKVVNFGPMMALQYLYLTDNMLTGDLPTWMLKNKASNKVNMDISYNNFTGNPPSECQQANVNMVSSFSSSNNNSLRPCLRKNLPCTTRPRHSSLFINCGGKSVVVDGNTYEDDSSQIGTSMFSVSDDKKWAYSSTGDFVGNENADYIARNTSKLNLAHPELYTEARLSPLSLKYYGLCMENGQYTVKLHFAEIVFTEDHTYSSNGKRVFDVFIQGVKVLEDFNIKDEIGGVHRAINKSFATNISDNTLEIHFYWGGKGTTAIPYRGVYGPLISAISVTKMGGNHGGVSTGVVVAIVIAAACLAVIVLITIYFKVFRKKNIKSSRQIFYQGKKTTTSELQARAQYFFNLEEIESATKHFDPANKIGEGGFGPVYKGTLANGTIVAVKKLSSKSSQGNREFLNEIGIISALRHPNLVRLFGCCIDGDQLLLIYEFLENNSLGRALFGRAEHQLKLDWPTRYNICLGTAKGLVYLHEESTLKIVHRDIKPSNILLDVKMQPKISDFGLAKLNDECGRVSTRIAGTVGYMAPEYATRGCLTRKADIYSYGVVALEIVSGMSNTNSMSNEEFLHLLDWAERLKQQGKLLQMVDRRLGSDYSQEQALRLLNVALLCTSTQPTQRPRMSSVVKMLRGEIPVEIVPADNDLSEDLQLNIVQSQHSINSSQTNWSQHSVNNSQTNWSETPSSPSVLPHSSKDSGYLPSSSSFSAKL